MSSNITQRLAPLWSSRFFVGAYIVALCTFLITCTIGSDGQIHRNSSLALAAQMQHEEESARTRIMRGGKTEPLRTNCVVTRETFTECLTKMINEENQIIETHRARILDALFVRDLLGYIPLEDILWLDDMKIHYGAKDERELLRRVDVIPLHMAMAQSILESGWGSSYAARVGNGLFGQIQSRGTHSVTVPWTPGPDRPQPFASHRESVTAYFINLNTHPAYAGFRSLREQTKDPIKLMGQMHRYSIRGQAYIIEVQNLIGFLQKK